MPDPKVETTIELAKRIGTYDKIDRSEQYKITAKDDGEGEERYSTAQLLKSDNHQWAKLRRLENRRLRDAVLVTLLSAALARAPEIAGFVASHWPLIK